MPVLERKMANVLVLYGSTTGNTADVAETIGRIFSGQGHSAMVKEVSTVKAEKLCEDYDLVLFGCSTWGDEDLELQSDFIDLFDNFDRIGAGGKNAAVFGCGDSFYTHYCGAVDAIEARFKELGGNILRAGLKIDGDPSAAQAEIESWAKELLGLI